VLVCFWSPKGGSGTSVVAAATAVMSARLRQTRLADLAGDLPAVLGLATDPSTGLRNWLRAGPRAPSEALGAIAVDAGRGLSLLPAGAAAVADAAPESGAALAVALRNDPRPTFVDAGVLEATSATPAIDAVVEVADASIIVVRACYLALRRAVRLEATARAAGVVLVEEGGRSLGTREVSDILGVPVLATVPCKTAVSRAVDAGVLGSRCPDLIGRPLRDLLARLHVGTERAA
jgi:hypothetical protein